MPGWKEDIAQQLKEIIVWDLALMIARFVPDIDYRHLQSINVDVCGKRVFGKREGKQATHVLPISSDVGELWALDEYSNDCMHGSSVHWEFDASKWVKTRDFQYHLGKLHGVCTSRNHDGSSCQTIKYKHGVS